MMNHQIAFNRTSVFHQPRKTNGMDALILSAMVIVAPLAIIILSFVCNGMR